MSKHQVVDKVSSAGQAEASYALLRHALTLYENTPAELDEQELAEVKMCAGREMAIQDVVLAHAMADGVSVSKQEVDTAMQELQSRYASKADFLNDLARNGLNKKGLQVALTRELKVAAILSKVESEAPEVTEAQVQEYYVQHQDRFVYPETREARHILITINDDFGENSREAALKRIQQIGWGIGRKPGRFGEQAAKHSECPTAMQEGKLGRIRRGQLYPELDAALFLMQEGSISQSLASEMGYHLLLCEKIHPAGQVSLEQATPKVRQLLQQSVARRYLRDCLEGLMEARAFVDKGIETKA